LVHGTRQCGANGFSGSGFWSSETLERSIPEMLPSKALLRPHTEAADVLPWDTMPAEPHWVGHRGRGVEWKHPEVKGTYLCTTYAFVILLHM
jgi:hypothetical protein